MQATRPILALALAVAAGLAGGAGEAETLTDALVSAYNNSDLLEQSRAVLRAADEDVAISVAALRPTLSYSLSEDYQYLSDPNPITQQQDSFSTNIDLLSTLDIYTGGRNRLTIDAAKEAVLAAREGLVSQEQSVFFEAVDAFFSVFAAVETVDLRRNSVRVLEEEVRAARDRFEVGEVTRTDVAQAEARLAQAEADLIVAIGDFEAAREDYNLEVGRYPGTLVAPPMLPPLPGTLEEARQIALAGHPDIRQAQRNVAFSEINVLIAEAAVLPTLSAQAQAGYSDAISDDAFDGDDFDFDASVGLELSGPIYQGGALNATFRQSRANRDQSRAVLLRTTALITEQVGRAWAVLESAQAQLEATEREIEAAQIAFDGTREEATLGARTTLDVLDSEQDLIDAQTSRVDARADEQVAAYGVLSAMGRLTVSFLDLPVTTYDPTIYYNSVRNAPAVGSAQGIQLDRVLRSIGRY